MSKSIDRVLQPDGSYRWEEVELKNEADEAPVVCPAPKPKATKKKPAKKKTTSPLTE